MSKRTTSSIPKSILTSPAYPWKTYEVFGKLKLELEAGWGRHLDYAQVGQVLGAPRNSVWRWCIDHDNPELRAFFCGLERLVSGETKLPEKRRFEIPFSSGGVFFKSFVVKLFFLLRSRCSWRSSF